MNGFSATRVKSTDYSSQFVFVVAVGHTDAASHPCLTAEVGFTDVI